MKMRFLLVLGRLESILKRCRPKSFSAGPPAPLDLAFPWISITGKEMLTSVFRKRIPRRDFPCSEWLRRSFLLNVLGSIQRVRARFRRPDHFPPRLIHRWG